MRLHDGWEFGWSQYTEVGRHALSDAEREKITWYDATVPGNAQSDLYRHNLLEDPFFADNADHYRWCEEVDFWYRNDFVPPEVTGDEKLILRFEGLDTFATVWLNQRQVASHKNMFVPLSVDITDLVTPAQENELVIRFGAPAFESGADERDPLGHPPPQRTRTRRAQITYGWDIGPRLLATGIWRPVTLETVSGGVIRHTGARTIALEDGGSAQLELIATVEWHGKPSEKTIGFSFDGQEVSQSVFLHPGANDIVVPTRIKDPVLWWPNGHGDQHLYQCTVVLEGDEKIAEAGGAFGICLVELSEEPRVDEGTEFRFIVNKRDFFAKGMNWTPNEVFFGSLSAERTSRLVEMTAEANMNMLRVWGGGIYEDDAFWDACDRHGILVWQDFMFSCALYPQDRDFLANVETEARSVIRAVRNHVSLAAWCGDNEIDMLFGAESGTRISKEVLANAVSELDPRRPYIVSSSFSREGRSPRDPASGDIHLWNHTIRHDDPFYTGFHANFVSEIGRISLPARKLIESYLPEKHLWPPTHPHWYYHSSDTNRWERYRNISDVLKGVAANGCGEPESLDQLIEVTQNIQADAYRFWIRHYGNDPYCWGLLLWNLCDIWPQMSDAVISYDLEPKKAYFAVKEAFAELDR